MLFDKKLFLERLKSLFPSKERGKIAKELGVHYESIRTWCNDRSKPNLAQLSKIAEHFDLSLNWLILGTGPKYFSDFKANPYELDINIIQLIIEKLEFNLKEKNTELSPKKKAKIITYLYKVIMENDGELQSETAKIVFDLMI